MQFYDHYLVLAAKINVFFTNTDSVNTQFAGVFVSDTASGITNDMDTLIENGRTRFKLLNPSGQNGHQKRVSMSINPNKFLNRSKPLSDPELKGSASTNPAEQCFFVLWARAQSSGEDSAAVNATVMIDYVACYFEPKVLAQS